IGRPVANTRMYVLDERLCPVPIGVAGELYIGGAGVARGYVNRPELTGERFVPDEFSGEAGARLYRTGDVGRVRGDGVFEYLGRNDEQVKIRGFRIELGEVEAVLKGHPEVQDAAVSTHGGGAGERELVAYLVAREGTTLPAVNQLRQYVGAKLPEYMIPSAFVTLPTLPLTANGKVDRRALPAPGQERPELEAAYVAPIYGLEFQLVQIWEDVLDVRPIGVTDNFFDLKGHSILAMRVMALVQRLFGQEFPISLLFEAPTIRQLAEALRQQAGLFSKTPLVRLQTGEVGRRPFFCIHAVGGTVMCYIALAQHLGADQPFYAFQAPDPETPPTTVEEIAAHYIEVLRSVQPRGPYLLGGWSFGGVAAFEMAQQLTRQGERVDLLALFDRPAPVFGAATEGETFDDVDEPRAMVRIAMEMAGQYARELPISFEHFETLGRTEQMEYVLAQAKRIELLPQEFQLSQMLRLLRGYKARAKAVFNYRPQPYKGPLTLFRASEIDPDDMNPELLELISRDPTMGWGQFLAEPPRIIWVPGFHGTMVQEPHVEVLAEKLRACIELTETE
ncbi:MAG: alpha/beta fold hydrolase, partial [Pyrinomonadaceae bacterium]